MLGFERTNGRIDAVRTSRGTVKAGVVLNCTAGWTSLISDMAGVPLPITTHILQACVTEPMKPLLDVVIVSSQMHVYLSQTDRGEFLMGAEIEPWTTYRMQGTLNFVQPLVCRAVGQFDSIESSQLSGRNHEHAAWPGRSVSLHQQRQRGFVRPAIICVHEPNRMPGAIATDCNLRVAVARVD